MTFMYCAYVYGCLGNAHHSYVSWYVCLQQVSCSEQEKDWNEYESTITELEDKVAMLHNELGMCSYVDATSTYLRPISC